MIYSKEFLTIASFIFALFLTYKSWNFANYFISRKETYINSRYQIGLKKLGFSLTIFIFSFKIMLSLLSKYFEIKL